MREIIELIFLIIWVILLAWCVCEGNVIGVVILEAIDIKHCIRTEFMENRGD